ncbi:MAG: 4Fe-4S dicluster domain-containing protein [Spirochaetes bacterium]|nr:4Fe-4S dicluster domain-containing protein [Spirochaetota bacterium]
MSMDKGLLQRKDLNALIEAVSRSAEFLAPAAIGEGLMPRETAFRTVKAPAEVSLGQINTRLSVKGVFFPQRETLMRFEGGAVGEVSLPKGPVVVFGVRPCDAKSLLFLDKLFSGEAGAPGNVTHQDPYYLERRKNATVIALACDEPCGSCFCTSVGGSPYGTDGADILASATDDAGGADSASASGPLLFEAVSEKGKAFLREHAALFTPPGPDAVSARESRAKAAAARMPVLDLAGLKEKADASFDSPVWEKITKICLGCGVCTYVCPTCHCFDITDETAGGRGVRIRTWDACQYPLYTMHSSGHNPRPAKRSRMRQRIMHKYSYTVETAGMVSCSGCGRCVRQCPVNLDIRQMLAAIRDAP